LSQSAHFFNDCEAFSSVDNHEETRGTSFSSDTVSSQYIQDAENTNVCMTVMTNARCNRLTFIQRLPAVS